MLRHNITSALVILIDDQDPGFWELQGWELDPVDPVGSLPSVGKLLYLPNFQTKNAPAHQLNSHLNQVLGNDWREKYPDKYVVTDSYFAADADPAGGARLLREMQGVEDLRWKRAVVYSEEPRLDGLTGLSLANVRPLKPRDSRDFERIRTYFETGTIPALEPLWKLIGDLKTLHLCCSVAVSRIQRSKAIALSPVVRYGYATEMTSGPEYIFEQVLICNSDPRPQVFTVDTQEYFSGDIKKEFEYHFNNARDLHLTILEKEMPEPGSAWERLCYSLHPVESLCSGSSIRLLWEMIQTGGNATLEGHQDISGPILTPREKCWISNRLNRLVGNSAKPELAGTLVYEVLEEYGWLLRIANSVITAESYSINR